MIEEQINLLTEMKQELLSKENNVSSMVNNGTNSEKLNNEQNSENVHTYINSTEAQRNHRMRMLRKARRSRR